MPTPLKTVYFDFGGVITTPQDPSLKKEIWNIVKACGRSEEEFWKTYFGLRHLYDADEVSVEEYWEQIGEDLGTKLDPETIARLIEIDDRSWSAVDRATLDFAESVRRKGISIGVLSNMPKRFFEMVLRPAPWLGIFDFLVISGEIGLIKPDPSIFRYACDLAKCRPEEILFFDDTVRNVDAARAFGMKAHHFTGVDRLPGEVLDALSRSAG